MNPRPVSDREVPDIKRTLPNLERLKSIAGEIPQIYEDLKKSIAEFNIIVGRARMAVESFETFVEEQKEEEEGGD